MVTGLYFLPRSRPELIRKWGVTPQTAVQLLPQWGYVARLSCFSWATVFTSSLVLLCAVSTGSRSFIEFCSLARWSVFVLKWFIDHRNEFFPLFIFQLCQHRDCSVLLWQWQAPQPSGCMLCWAGQCVLQIDTPWWTMVTRWLPRGMFLICSPTHSFSQSSHWQGIGNVSHCNTVLCLWTRDLN